MYRVLITDSLSKAGLKILEQTEGIEVVVKSGLTPAQVREELKTADGIIIRSGTTLTAEHSRRPGAAEMYRSGGCRRG